MRLLFILTSLFTLVYTQEHFRSILIERACLKRPTLDFCSEVTTQPPTTTTKSVTEKHPVELILPPNPEKVPVGPMREPLIAVPHEESQKVESNQNREKSHTENKPDSEGIIDFHEKTADEQEKRGSLLRLPKPATRLHEEEQPTTMAISVIEESMNATLTTTTGNPLPNSENSSSILVFVSEYCVIEREHFVRGCHGDVNEEEVPFCKSYPAACASTQGVIPVISYCQRYYKSYPKHCTGDTVEGDVVQFCYAFEQFCLPELTPAKPAIRAPTKSSIKRCEDVVEEARKICNPFPHPKDTFNVLRCTQFFTNCKKFIDWA